MARASTADQSGDRSACHSPGSHHLRSTPAREDAVTPQILWTATTCSHTSSLRIAAVGGRSASSGHGAGGCPTLLRRDAAARLDADRAGCCSGHVDPGVDGVRERRDGIGWRPSRQSSAGNGCSSRWGCRRCYLSPGAPGMCAAPFCSLAFRGSCLWLSLTGYGIGRITFYGAGNDHWTFQRVRVSHRDAGLLARGRLDHLLVSAAVSLDRGRTHLVLGDSSVGETYWDGACVAVPRCSRSA